MIDSGRFRSGKAGILPLLAVALSLGACAANSYMGIPLAPGAAPSELQRLAGLARAGDKQAQLDLGIRYENGTGLPANLERARKLYRAAATPTGGTIYVYVPATRKGEKGNVTPVDTGPRVEGLVEAKARLAHVEAAPHAEAE